MKPIVKASEIDLSPFATIDLLSLNNEHFQDRVDTKFVLHQAALPVLLNQLKSNYHVLSVEGSGIQPYKNLYFDDERLSFYLHHHDRKGNRCKVRLREYVNSNLVFFEIKQKINKDRTLKQRIPHLALHETLSMDAQHLFRQVVSIDASHLLPTLWCDFNRITLLSFDREERITMDYNIVIRNTQRSISYDGLALIEVKHASSKPSAFNALARKNGIKKMSISKYIMGIAHLHPDLKQNNFRMKLLTVERIINKNGTRHGI